MSRAQLSRRAVPGLALILALVMIGACITVHAATVKEALRPGAAPAQSLLRNGALDALGPQGFADWSPYGLGYAVDKGASHTGAFSARCDSASPDESRGISRIVELSQSAAAPIIADCWSKAESASPGRPGDYSLYLDLEYSDGSPLYGQIAAFDPGTHDWQHAVVTVVPTKPVKRVALYGLFRNRTGIAWFDDFALWQPQSAGGASQFDGVPIVGGSTHAAEVRAVAPTMIETPDGLAVPVDAPASGILVRDVAARSDFIRPEGKAERKPDGAVIWRGQDETLGLALSATFRVTGNAIRIDGEVRDLTRRDRAVTVYFTYPVSAVGWRWHDDQGTARMIEASGAYENVVSSGAGANGLASRYPLACISGENDAIAIAVPLDVPRLCRLGYDASSRELYAAFDLGLASDTERFPSAAPFSLVLYRADPDWGFRSALERYYQLFPHCFTKRNAKEGLWMPFTDISTVEGYEDFGFQFKEGDNNVAWEAEHGIYSFVYVEPWSDWVSMPKEMPRTIEQATAYVKGRAAEGHEKDQAVLSSAYANADGSWAARIEDQPWCDGAVFGVNPAPGVEPAAPGALTQYENLIRRINHAFERSPQLTGVYHDSFEMYLFHNFINYRREQWRKAAIPLVFDSEGRVGQYAMFTMVEFARDIAERMWPSGHMTFANGAPHASPWGAAWLDVMGTEAAWASSWGTFGEYVPESASDFNYWRALCYQRPYLMLLNTRYDLWKPEWIELYMKRCTAWAVFPSMFSHNASEDPYWQNPALYNRDRPLFKKYVPVVSALNAAGWEPVTYARSSNPKVYLERYGRRPGPIYLTVYNDSDQPQAATIMLALSQLGAAPNQPALREVLSGAPVPTVSAPGGASFQVQLSPGDVKVIAVE